MARRVAGGVGVAILLMMTGAAVAQIPVSTAPPVVPDGYAVHETVDLGGHMVGLTGAGSMYDTLVNMQSGPRVLGVTYEMHALPSNKNSLFDDLKAFSNGFGGDPFNFSKLDASKGKYYEFSGMFRRDRQYFDYNLLGNPNIIPGRSIPIGPATAPTGSLSWPQVNNSPVMFNTVRRMTDVNLTFFPMARVTYRVAYSHYTFEGPTLSPSYTIAKYDALLQQYQRNGTDDFVGAIDWKPERTTKLTFEEHINHYKMDSFFTLDPNGFMVQEADGTKAYLGNWDSQTPYNSSACNANSMGGNPVLSAPQSPGGMPVINPACAVVTSYTRAQPTRILLPTEIFRLQTTRIKNVSMNGEVRYTLGTMDLPNYYENVQGLTGAIRTINYTGYARGHRAMFVANYGISWQVNNRFSLMDQVNYSSLQQPGYSYLPVPTTLSTPTTPPGEQTITYSGPLTAGNAFALPHGNTGKLMSNYFGQSFVINNVTASWDATSRSTFSLTYRYGQHKIGQGVPHAGPIPVVLPDPVAGTVIINENGGILNAVVHPMDNLDLNGSIEMMYNDNAFTPVTPRQMKQYRVHAKYTPKAWATFTGSFNDVERHNNTNNNQAVVAAGEEPYEGPLDHVDYSRVIGIGGVLSPKEYYSIDFNYAFSDVYSATNICYDNGAQNPSTTVGLPGTASLNSNGVPNVCPGVYTRGSTTQLADWFARDFMQAPTQTGSVGISINPIKSVHSDLGYQINSVDGSRFYNDARDVAGSLVSTYQTPYVNLAWTSRPGLVWSARYDFYGYGEGGPSGSPYCSTSTSITSAVVPCTSLSSPTGLTEPPSGLTAPRNFHANMVSMGVHYEF